MTKAELSELKDMYSSGTGWNGIKEMAKYFKKYPSVIKWAVDYKDYRKKQTEKNSKWQKNNPEKYKEIVKKAVYKYAETEKGKEVRRKAQKKQYLKLKNNPEKHKAYLKKRMLRYYAKKLTK